MIVWIMNWTFGCADNLEDGGVPTAGDDGPCRYQIGWTRDVRGGLGGEIIRVTTLASDGPGSLREALGVARPRVIVFEVAGVIDLGTESLHIDEPFVTVAGQTAPSPGITLIRAGLKISAHDVVLQHLRIRPGEAGQSRGWEPDGISTDSAHDVVVDHCSVTWAIDENLSASGPRFEGETPEQWRENTSHRITFSHNIIAEGLSKSTHSKGEHSKGTLVHDNVTNILIYNNLYASNLDRNPLFKGGSRGAVVNNFIANPGYAAISYFLLPWEWGAKPFQTGMMSIVGNVFHYGADTLSFVPLLWTLGPLEVFFADNLMESLSGDEIPRMGGISLGRVETESPPTWPEEFTASPSADVLQMVRDSVGARPWERDAIDERIVDQALSGTLRHIDHEDEGGGYPQYTPTSAPFDPASWDSCFERIDK